MASVVAEAFHEEAVEMMRLLLAPSQLDHDHVLRLLHTLKGNALCYQEDAFASAVDSLESRLSREGRAMTQADAEQLQVAWNTQPRSERGATAQGGHARHSPISARLEVIAQHTRQLAIERGLGRVTVVVSNHTVGLVTTALQPVFSALVHLIRNALDHGIEPTAQRIACGKAAVGTVTLRAERVKSCLEISVSDDGRGIDWHTVRSQALRTGLAVADDADLVEALFHHGLSTCAKPTGLSGRGVGLCVVRQACSDCGGQLWVTSARHEGTTITLRF